MLPGSASSGPPPYDKSVPLPPGRLPAPVSGTKAALTRRATPRLLVAGAARTTNHAALTIVSRTRSKHAPPLYVHARLYTLSAFVNDSVKLGRRAEG